MKRDRKILILGASSYIGRNLYIRLGRHRSTGTFNIRPVDGCMHFDILRMNISDIINDHRSYSHAVILIGNVSPDLCAKNVEETNYLNVTRISGVIDELNYLGIIPVFISTEVVFDGRKGDYIETDKVNPILRYGIQKVEVENYLQKNSRKFIIVRLAKVYGCDLNDDTLFTSWLGKIMRNERIICARDSIFSPIHIDDVSEGIMKLIENDSSGIFHLANKNAYTRLEMLNMLIKCCKKYRPQDNIQVSECSLLDLPTLEKRPLNTSLNPEKAIRETGLCIRDIEESCKRITEEALGKNN